jgi:hypothetical protein
MFMKTKQIFGISHDLLDYKGNIAEFSMLSQLTLRTARAGRACPSSKQAANVKK